MSVAPMPGIHRTGRPTGHFTVVANDFARSTLPARAIKVGLYLMSHAEGFQQTHAQIATTIGMAVRTVAAALRDLVDAGLLTLSTVRARDGHRATRYDISDQQPAGSAPAKSAGPKKNRSRRDTEKIKKNIPSGGDAAAAALPTLEAPTTQEDPMRAPAAEPALFDLPAQEKLGTAARPPKPDSQLVVAEFVESHRKHHGGQDPARSAIGRVGRDAKSLLQQTGARLEDLLAAAREMGSGPYSNLPVAWDIHVKRGTRGAARGRGMAPPARRGHPEFVAALDRQTVSVQAMIERDPSLAAWLAGGAVA